ncbi:MAG: hypothetical protein ACPGU7_04850, partial [Gammaproteobacteria bacterium]
MRHLILLPLLLVICLPARALDPVVPGQQYPGGSRVQLAVPPVSFRIPEGWVGLLPVGGENFLMRSIREKGYFQVMVMGGSPTHLAGTLNGTLRIEYDIHLLPLAEATISDARVSNRFAVTNTAEPFRARVVALSRAPQLGLAFVGMGPTADEARF